MSSQPLPSRQEWQEPWRQERPLPPSSPGPPSDRGSRDEAAVVLPGGAGAHAMRGYPGAVSGERDWTPSEQQLRRQQPPALNGGGAGPHLGSEPPSPHGSAGGASHAWDLQLAAAGTGVPALAGPGGGGDQFWSSSQANLASSVEQKVSALSRRTAAEMRRAERERGEHSRRLEALEDLCRQHLGGLEERLAQARQEAVSEAERATQRTRARFERDLELLSEVLQQHKSESTALQERTSDALKALTKRVDADHDSLEELRAWRREAEKQLADHADSAGSSSKIDRLEERLEEEFEEKLESSLSRERKQAHERLRSSCSELTAHLNELRTELVEQRQVAEQLEGRRERLRHDLEAQIAELGGALALRLQAKISSTVKALEDRLSEVQQEAEERTTTLESSDEWLGGQVQQWRREHAELRGHVQNIQEMARRESEQAMDVAREEARVVHMEVMSVDTRLASLEERLNDDVDTRRYRALQRVQMQERSGGGPGAEGLMNGTSPQKTVSYHRTAPTSAQKQGSLVGM